ncbi:MAG: DUF4402 domain-containing protein [Sphingomonas sp.]|nr:DUF4402 domain-containing protein [Sphingomonas sp.]
MRLDRRSVSILAWAMLAVAADAQSLSIDPIAGMALGNVTSATIGTTVFQISASSGAVSRSGGGSRLGAGSARSLVAIGCGSDPLCATSDVAITITAIGSPTGRAGALGNFTISALSAQVKAGPSGTGTVTFTIGPIGTNDSRTFYVGADFPILGDESAAATGVAATSFQVSAQFTPSGMPIAQIGSGSAAVFRPIALAGTADLAFGTVTRPRSGSGTVSIDAATGDRILSGDGVIGIGSGPHRATYTVTGEGGQAYSVSVPATFTMTGPGDPITVTLTTTASGMQTLDGSLGGAGTASIGVGGSFTLASDKAGGNYSGSFVISVEYQ